MADNDVQVTFGADISGLVTATSAVSAAVGSFAEKAKSLAAGTAAAAQVVNASLISTAAVAASTSSDIIAAQTAKATAALSTSAQIIDAAATEAAALTASSAASVAALSAVTAALAVSSGATATVAPVVALVDQLNALDATLVSSAVSQRAADLRLMALGAGTAAGRTAYLGAEAAQATAGVTGLAAKLNATSGFIRASSSAATEEAAGLRVLALAGVEAGESIAAAGAKTAATAAHARVAGDGVSFYTRELRALGDEAASGRWRQFDGSLLRLITHGYGIAAAFVAANPLLTAFGVAAAAAGTALAYLTIREIEFADAAQTLRAASNLSGGFKIPADQLQAYLAILEKAKGSDLEFATAAIKAFQDVQGATSASVEAMVADFVLLTAAGKKPAEAIKELADIFGTSLDDSLKAIKILIPGITEDQEASIRASQRQGDISAAQAKIQLALAENTARTTKEHIANNEAQIASDEATLAAQRKGGIVDEAQAYPSTNLDVEIERLKAENVELEKAAANVQLLSDKIRSIPQTPDTIIKSGEEAGKGYGQTGAIAKTEADIARLSAAIDAMKLKAAGALGDAGATSVEAQIKRIQSFVDVWRKQLAITVHAGLDAVNSSSGTDHPGEGTPAQNEIIKDAADNAERLRKNISDAEAEIKRLRSSSDGGILNSKEYKDAVQQLKDANTRLKELRATQAGGTAIQKTDADIARAGATIEQDALATAQKRLAVAKATLAADTGKVNAEQLAKDNQAVTDALNAERIARNNLTDAVNKGNEVAAKGTGNALAEYNARIKTLEAEKSQTQDNAKLQELNNQEAQAKIEYLQQVRQQTITTNQGILSDEESTTKKRIDDLNELLKTHQITNAQWLTQTKAALDAEAAKFTEVKTAEENLDGTTAEQRARTAEELKAKLNQIADEEKQAEVKSAEQTAQAWQTATSQINSAFDAQVDGLLTGTEKWGQAFKKIVTSLTEDLIKSGLNKLLTGIEGQVGTASGIPGASTNSAGGLGSLLAPLTAALGLNTASMAAGTGLQAANTAAVGVNTVSTAANTGAVSAQTAAGGGGLFGGLFRSIFPFFEKGTPYVPFTGLALVHQGERIIPANENNRGFSNSTYTLPPRFGDGAGGIPTPRGGGIADALGSVVSNAAAGGRGGNVSINPAAHYHVNALDTASGAQWLRDHSEELSRAMNDAVKRGATLGLRRLGR